MGKTSLFTGIALLAVIGVTSVAAKEKVNAGQKKPLKVVILCGQSNMQGHAQVKTFDRMAVSPELAPMLREMRNAEGTPRVCEKVWISSIGCAEEEQVGKLTAGFGASKGGPKIGPEFTFGIYMQKLLDEPILIIKTAWGGKSLNTDFRPPGAEPYAFNETQLKRFEEQGKDLEKIKADKVNATGRYYRLMIDHVKKVTADIKRIYPDYDPDQGFELAGFVWFQGWNDMVDRSTYPQRDKPGGYDPYRHLLEIFIRNVRKDLVAPRMPFVIGVMGTGGPTDKYGPEKLRYQGIHQNFRNAMAAPAALPEFKGNVAAVLTENYWDMELGELRAREAKLRKTVQEQLKEERITKKAEKATLEKMRAEAFTPREIVILEKGASNAEFHYWGSALTMAGIGKGFAEALVEMMPGRNLD